MGKLESALGISLAQECATSGFAGKEGQSLYLHVARSDDATKPAKQILLVGLGHGMGEKGAPSALQLRNYGLQIASSMKWNSLESLGLLVVGECTKAGGQGEIEKKELNALALDTAETCAVVSAILARAEPDLRFRSSRALASSTDSRKKNDVAIYVAGGDRNGLLRGSAVARGMRTALELVNAPPNYVNPTTLAAFAERIASTSELLACKTLNAEQCSAFGEHGMQLFLGVGSGSVNPPQLIHLRYTSPEFLGDGNAEPSRKIAVVGKGVTFDSGGYNLKVGEGSMIDVMKFDMGGAAATLGAAETILALQPPGVQIDFIVPACENLISGGAMLPGSVLRASDGTTVEVNNTDAEGRLALADALLYAQDQGAEEIIDVATLTGACIIALGDETAGVFAHSERFAKRLLESAAAAGESVWRMPLQHAYAKQLKSDIADMKNTGTRAGGSITAALFLHRFINHEKVSWAHVDIAGPVWDAAKGTGTGFGVATLVHHILGGGQTSSK
ncbi:Leucine aminopeptidase 1 [Hondaea fermentalgiana]|uniref:Leucine aminopeptidase 1 n=1 Tax=Hondaea fermentalgiana TaxID=2315210 RepID=A0A2R5GSM8_9STRA|nr:Leucine aminopeptidase 1 [Hondaea fermentalgiana]|eukprot:GBG31653.1 Leucine aminopeptidase 1 [Hondaea fermentalgiana]